MNVTPSPWTKQDEKALRWAQRVLKAVRHA